MPRVIVCSYTEHGLFVHPPMGVAGMKDAAKVPG